MLKTYRAYILRGNEISLTPLTSVLAHDWADAENRISKTLQMNRGRRFYFNEWNRCGRIVGICLSPEQSPYQLKVLHVGNMVTAITG